METKAIAAEGNARRYAKSALITAAIFVLLFLLSLVSNVTLSVKYAERELDVQLRKLAEVFSSHDFPQSCRARIFPFLFEVDAEAVDASDLSFDDWSNLRQAALRDKQIEVLNSFSGNYRQVNLRCGDARTPTPADHFSTPMGKAVGSDFGLTVFGFSLSFAWDRDGDVLYFLGELEGLDENTLPDRFRVKLFYGDRTSETFLILRNTDDSLALYLGGSNDTADGPESGIVAITWPGGRERGRHGAEFSGTWWSEGGEDDKPVRQYLEIQLKDLDSVTALHVGAERLSENNNVELKVTTKGPVPLYQDERSYQVTRLLSPTVDYRLFSSEDMDEGEKPTVIAGTSFGGEALAESRFGDDSRAGRQDEPPPGHLLASVFDAMYRMAFGVLGYEPCSVRAWEEGEWHDDGRAMPCFRFSESESGLFRGRIQRGAPLSSPESDQRARVLIVETAPEFDFRDSWPLYVLFPFILLMVWWRTDIGVRRRQALVEGARKLDSLREELDGLHRSRQELEGANSRLASANVTLQYYDRLFIHQASRHFARLKEKISSLLHYAGLKGTVQESEVHASLAMVLERLERSITLLRYPEIIRNLVLNHGHNRVCLNEVIENVIECMPEERKPDFDFRPIEDENPQISGTSPSDEDKDAPESYFVEALESVLINAVEYGDVNTPIVVSLRREETKVVIAVSNDGPTVLDDKLKSVFEFGVRVSGAGSTPEPPEDSDEEHLGIGLFVTKQVVDGYQGACFMENRSDGSGVIVTIQLPCVDGEAAEPGT